MSLSSVTEIKNFIRQKEKYRLETFNEILAQIKSKIDKSVTTSQSMCYFDIPVNLIGRPSYNLHDAIKYIIISLKKEGFEIRFFEPRSIVISWAHVIEDALKDVAHQIKYNVPEPKYIGNTPSLHMDNTGCGGNAPPKAKSDFQIIFKKDENELKSRTRNNKNNKIKEINSFIPKTNSISDFMKNNN